MRFISLILIAALFLPSCAAIFTGTKQNIHVEVTPPDASIKLDGNIICQNSPCDFTLKKNHDDHYITIEKEGYESKTFEIEKEFNLVTVLDILTILGLIVDFGMGTYMKYDPTFYNITLNAKK